MSKIERIETSNFDDVRLGDSICIRFDREAGGAMTMSGLHVKGRPGKLYVSIGREYRGGPERFLNLKDVTEDHTLESIVRGTPRPRYRREIKEIDFTRYDSKHGSRAALEDALHTVQSVEDYFEYRIGIGDPLFDQWLVDAYNSSKKAVQDIEDLMKALGHRKEEEEEEE